MTNISLYTHTYIHTHAYTHTHSERKKERIFFLKDWKDSLQSINKNYFWMVRL